ncbi:tetratricopeptide repeat protein [candidate division KSB1 bacterium]|nr:tetratricopeptide repeat protein [candidate division KSB1 bacterium]
MALGGSLVVQARDPSTIYWNPAALSGLKDREMLISINGPFTFDFVSLTQVVPLIGTFGASLSRLPALPERVDRGTLAWGRRLYKRVFVGNKFDFLKQDSTLFASTGLGIFFGNPGVGVLDKQWQEFANSKLLDKLNFGMTVHNIPLGKRIFEPSVMFGFSYIFPAPGLLLNTGYHIQKGENTNHLGLGFEFNRKVTIFLGLEDLDFNESAVGFQYTRDNFVFNFSYSKNSDKLLFTLSARISPAPAALAERYYERGVERLTLKKYKSASREFKKYLDFDLLDAKSDSTKILLSDLTKRLARTEVIIDSLFLLSSRLLTQENPKFFRAAYVLTRIKELDPDNFDAAVKLNALKPAVDVLIKKSLSDGDAEFNAEKYFAAERSFKRVLIFDKKHPTATKYLADIDKIKNELAEEYFFRGLGYYRDKSFRIAEQEFKRALKFDEKKEEVIKYLGRTRQEIRKNLKRVSKLLREGEALEQQRNYVGATNKYLEVLKLDPGNSPSTSSIAKLRPKINRFIQDKYTKGLRFHRNENYPEAIEAFLNVLSINPDHLDAKRKLARVRLDRREKAFPYLKQGEMFFQQGDWQSALESYAKALEIEPSNSKALQGEKDVQKKLQIVNLIERGRQKVNEKQYLQAETIFGDILRMDPGNRIVKIELNDTRNKINELTEEYFNDGINLFTLDRYQDAIGIWNKVLELDSNHKGALEYKQKAIERIEALKRIQNR